MSSASIMHPKCIRRASHVLGQYHASEKPLSGSASHVMALAVEEPVRCLWMYNCISVVIFHASWKLQSHVFGTTSEGSSAFITAGSFGQKQAKSFNHTGLLQAATA